MRPPTPGEDARVGLAGPVWGLGAAIAAYAGYLVTGNALWAAVAHAGAWINLFNLLPVWQLDGGRAFAALTAPQRWLAALILGVLWVGSHEGLLVLLLLAAIGQAWFDRTAPQQPDHGALAIFAGLALALTYLSATSALPSIPI
jgi:Zn-dependent protease